MGHIDRVDEPHRRSGRDLPQAGFRTRVYAAAGGRWRRGGPMSGIPRRRDYRGPVLLSYGFRPFFLFGAIYAGLAILAWLPMFSGALELSTAFSPGDWHVHEMLYGYLPAVVTGFLLTAIPNWTGRLPIQGMPLLVLFS